MGAVPPRCPAAEGLILLLLQDGAEARGAAGALGRRAVGTLGVEQPAQGHQGHDGIAQELLLDVAEVVLPLEPLELVEGGRGGLVEEQGHGARLVGLGHEDGVAPQHHRLVLHLVPVDPREHLGVPAVGGAVGDAVQEVPLRGLLHLPASPRPRGCGETPGNVGKRPPPPRARRRTRARSGLG
uniref:Uncharacterized protein n=1 Tax=Amazona collaria TaxID=241587 RepID=A0A8B9FSG8_9PSIT